MNQHDKQRLDDLRRLFSQEDSRAFEDAGYACMQGLRAIEIAEEAVAHEVEKQKVMQQEIDKLREELIRQKAWFGSIPRLLRKSKGD